MKPDKIRKVGRIIISVCFIAPVFAIGVYSFICEKPVFSELENRELSTAPNLFTETGINSKYYTELEKYYADTFPFRETLLAINRQINGMYTVLPFKTEDDISFVTVDNGNQAQNIIPVENTETTKPADSAQEGTETATPASQEEYEAFVTMPIVDGRTFEMFDYNESRTKNCIELIDYLAEKCDVPTYVIMPPSAADIYFPDKYRKPENDQKQAFDLMEASFKNAVFVNLYDEFHAAKEEYIYFRTDHHWTADGAYLAYKKFGETEGFEPVGLGEMQYGVLDNFLGSLHKMISQSRQSELLSKTPDSVKYYFPLYDTEVYNYQTAGINKETGEKKQLLYPGYAESTNLYNVFFGGDMTLMHMKSSVANGKSIMVVRDSYGHAFLGYLANNYEDVYAVEPRYFASFPLESFIAENNIDELLFIGYSLPATSNYWMNWATELQKLTE